MRDFFHASTAGYTKAARVFPIAVGILFAMPCLLCFMSLMLETRSYDDAFFVAFRLTVPVVLTALWLVLSFLFYVAVHLRMKNVSRYTYFEIQPSCAVYSEYAGSWSLWGSRTHCRRLYVMRFDKATPGFDPTDGTIVFKGVIRRYDGDSERLGYHVKRGEMRFDNWWLDDNGYTELNKFVLPKKFAKTAFIFRCIRVARKRYTVTAERRAQTRSSFTSVIRRPPVARPRSRKRVYTEIPTFNRKW